MATATKNTHTVNEAAEQVAQLNERMVEAGKRAGSLYLDSVDKLVDSVAAFQTKLAEQSRNESIQTLIATQADVTRQIASAYTSAARELIA